MAVAKYSSRWPVSCKLITLLANCLAVVVFPHHFGPSMSTAPIALRCALSRTSKTLFRYAILDSCFMPQRQSFYFELQHVHTNGLFYRRCAIRGGFASIPIPFGSYLYLFDFLLFGCGHAGCPAQQKQLTCSARRSKRGNGILP